MPEITELTASHALVKNFLETYKDEPLILKKLWVDATIAETEAAQRSKSGKNSPAAHELPYPLRSNSVIERGPYRAQQRVYPEFLAKTKTEIATCGFRLKNTEFNPRNLIFQLVSLTSAQLWIQVQFLTHTVVQIYRACQWTDSICQTAYSVRHFRVGLALDFGTWVIAFLTLDNMFTPFYATKRARLPAQHADVYAEFPEWLNAVVEWAAQRARNGDASRSRFAMYVIRDARDVWGGVGVYTVAEIFFMAGLSPFLTEAEIFDCPSRFARLCEAYYTFAATAHEGIWDFIRPHVKDNHFLAVRNEDRLRYQDWLHVHAKSRVWMSERMSTLLKRHTAVMKSNTLPVSARLATDDEIQKWLREPGTFYDVFEPTLIRAGLEKTANLGHLVFGGADVWCSMGGVAWTSDNPLDAYFRQRNIPLSAEASFLDTTLYATPFLTAVKRSWVPSILYRIDDSDVWSIHFPFPDASLPFNYHTASQSFRSYTFETCSEAIRAAHLFAYIVKCTMSYAVGPLDFCGVARIIKDT
ncbi:hypothetical protein BDZ89DRAFT_1152618 [Hymenopellis radicata]|nr:hypothetical protein BDZ89DRAFT_1152618 [Hymenopellis radicata]